MKRDKVDDATSEAFEQRVETGTVLTLPSAPVRIALRAMVGPVEVYDANGTRLCIVQLGEHVTFDPETVHEDSEGKVTGVDTWCIKTS